MKIETYPDREMLAMDVANILAGELKSALRHSEVVTFAVPGGTTPGPIFDNLCAVDIEWNRVNVIPTDERWVPEDHARSNARLIRERLLTNYAAAATLIPFYRDQLTVGEGAHQVSAVLEKMLPISVLLLGMGEDMHTASLFPGAPGLDDALDPEAPAAVAVRPVDQPEARLSLSAVALEGALSKHLVIKGEAKRAAFERAMTQPAHIAPISAVMGGGRIHWVA